jgi:hypothetical protein
VEKICLLDIRLQLWAVVALDDRCGGQVAREEASDPVAGGRRNVIQ